MSNFWRLVDKVIGEADVVLLVLDARMVEETKNDEIIAKVKRAGKQLIYVLNKCDLIDQKTAELYKKKLKPCVFVSAIKYYGTTMLRKKILEVSRGKECVVGIVGYPNTGKSSIINALKGKSSAPTSSMSGFTKAIQKVRVDTKITILDTPGVLAQSDDKTSEILTLTASRTQTKDPELAALLLIKNNLARVKDSYGVDGEDEEELLENIALKLNRKISGGKPDTYTVAKILLKDWQDGKI